MTLAEALAKAGNRLRIYRGTHLPFVPEETFSYSPEEVMDTTWEVEKCTEITRKMLFRAMAQVEKRIALSPKIYVSSLEKGSMLAEELGL